MFQECDFDLIENLFWALPFDFTLWYIRNNIKTVLASWVFGNEHVAKTVARVKKMLKFIQSVGLDFKIQLDKHVNSLTIKLKQNVDYLIKTVLKFAQWVEAKLKISVTDVIENMMNDEDEIKLVMWIWSFMNKCKISVSKIIKKIKLKGTAVTQWV